MNDLDITKLVRIVADGIRLLRTRDGVVVTDAQCTERARNIVSAVIVNYEMRELPAIPEGAWPIVQKSREELMELYPNPKVAELRELYAQGKPQGHGHSCACRDCKVFNQSRRAQ